MHKPGHIVVSAHDRQNVQEKPLCKYDFVDIENLINSFGTGAAYYTSGLESGCTQLHKHLQFTPLPEMPLLNANSLFRIESSD